MGLQVWESVSDERETEKETKSEQPDGLENGKSKKGVPSPSPKEVGASGGSSRVADHVEYKRSMLHALTEQKLA